MAKTKAKKLNVVKVKAIKRKRPSDTKANAVKVINNTAYVLMLSLCQN